ncbi:MAG: TonB family protein, partial [Moraxella sp.]|nr:TonB family protein [Moraxella sp.]
EPVKAETPKDGKGEGGKGKGDQSKNKKDGDDKGKGQGGKGKDDQSKNEKDGGKDEGGKGKSSGGGEIKGQDLSGRANANWRSKPRFIGLSSETVKGAVTVQATVTINAQGRITNVTITSTGDRALDQQIRSAIRRASFHPFKNDKGQVLSGTATFPINVNVAN